jgi:hypothetical protein
MVRKFSLYRSSANYIIFLHHHLCARDVRVVPLDLLVVRAFQVRANTLLVVHSLRTKYIRPDYPWIFGRDTQAARITVVDNREPFFNSTDPQRISAFGLLSCPG